MAKQQLQTLENPSSEDQYDDAEDEFKLKEMAELIRHYRTTLPNRITKAFSSLLAAQRPIFHSPSQISEIGVSGDRNPDAGNDFNSGKGALQAEDQENAEKIQLLKLHITRNIAAMPVVLKRMNDCISMIDKLDVYNGSIPPAFKRKRTS